MATGASRANIRPITTSRLLYAWRRRRRRRLSSLVPRGRRRGGASPQCGQEAGIGGDLAYHSLERCVHDALPGAFQTAIALLGVVALVRTRDEYLPCLDIGQR